ncbi:MAG: deiodinase family protein, partial [Gemmataceae bacterium]
MRALLVAGVLLAASEAALGAEPPPKETEFYEMLAGILTGSQMAPGDGWFHDAQNKHTWAWLAEKHRIPPATGSILAAHFRGPKDLFTRLDRDGDKRLTADDLDWSANSKQAAALAEARSLTRRFDRDMDNALSAEEWGKIFEQAAGKNKTVTPEQLRRLLHPAALPQANFSNPADAPSTWTLLRGLTRNEIGSTFPGASVGDTAPNFTLKSMDGKKEVTLADYRGKTPVVLVFGNYSCGPFRFQYRAVEELQRIYGEKVTFLAIYVREAHPTEGWKMASNEKMGVRVAQPRTDEDRAAVATQCAKALNMTMPVLVDTVA